jgi:cell division septum initiation protein DivIVA
LKDLDDKFAIIEKRVRALVAKNKSLTDRIRELEQELAQARQTVRELEHVRGARGDLRDRIENVLQALEQVNLKQ